MESYFISLMTINLLCVAIIGLSGWQRRYIYLGPLIVLNIILFGYHWVSLQYHTSTSLSQAIELNRWHNALILIAMPIMVFVFGYLSRFRYTRQIVYIYILAIAVILAFNVVTSGSIRFGGRPVIEQVIGPFGEQITLLRGAGSHILLLFHVLSLTTILLIAVFAVRFFKQRRNLLSIALVTYLIAQLVTSYLSYLIDAGLVNMFYLGGLPLSILSLLTAMTISARLKTTSAALADQQRRRIELETAFARIAQTVSTSGSQDFYRSMVSTLYDFTKADMVILGQISANDPGQVDTLVVLQRGKNAPNFSYPLKGTPCEKTLADGICAYSSGVASAFPDDLILSEQGIESYFGVSFQDQNNAPMGLLILLNRRPTPRDDNIDLLMRVFSARAGAEFQRDQLQTRLQQMAYCDYMSGLPNRAKLLDVINQTYFDCQRTGTNAMLMLIDLDNFGEINRKYGNDVGDQLIKLLGSRLAHYASNDVFIARNSGDEFVVLVKRVTHEAVSLMNVHWAALSGIINSACELGRRRLQVACSMGAVVFPEQITDRFDVIGAAEHALAQAKNNGRNQCSMFNPAMLASLVSQQELRNELIEAINANEQLHVAFQPKVTVDGECVGAEALLRWNHPEKGYISPGEFIPLAEETGVIHELGMWVLTEVCKQIREWKKSGLPFGQIAINVASNQFDDMHYADKFIKALQIHDVDPADIEIEITESSLLAGNGPAVEHLIMLRGQGVSVALDDFGTGYSSLSYLRELPVDVLKIDKSFIDSLSDVRNAELVKAIIAIANVMRFDIIAEGTEYREQVDELTSMGCRYFQGYYFSPPLSAAEFGEYTRSHRLQATQDKSV